VAKFDFVPVKRTEALAYDYVNLTGSTFVDIDTEACTFTWLINLLPVMKAHVPASIAAFERFNNCSRGIILCALLVDDLVTSACCISSNPPSSS
jgi:hypothetical protein